MGHADKSTSKTMKEHIENKADRVKRATSDTVAYTKEALHSAADRVESGLHHATDKVARAVGCAADKATDLGEQGREFYSQAADRTNDWLEQMRERVREKPVQSIAVAVGGGWLLGRLLRR